MPVCSSDLLLDSWVSVLLYCAGRCVCVPVCVYLSLCCVQSPVPMPRCRSDGPALLTPAPAQRAVKSRPQRLWTNGAPPCSHQSGGRGWYVCVNLCACTVSYRFQLTSRPFFNLKNELKWGRLAWIIVFYRKENDRGVTH